MSSARIVVATFDNFPLGSSSVLGFQVVVNGATSPGQTIINTASTSYTTLPCPVVPPISPYNPDSAERTGNPADPGGAANNLATSASAPVTLGTNSLQGTVYVDANNDGVIQPGEQRLPGVTITLGGSDNLGNPVTSTTTTDASGNYSFFGLRPGAYTLTETQPAGFLSGKNTVGSQGGTAAPPPANVLSSLILPVGASTDGIGNNFGELVPSSLAGTVFVDLNDNGVQDPGDPGIPGVTITLTGTDDLAQPIHTVVSTDAGGHYAFNELRPGTYTITETQPSGYYSGKNSIGTQGGTVGPNDTLTSIILQPGVNGTGNNFAELPAGSLSGFVYWDVNHDGVMDSPDFGIVNVLITLDGVDLQGLPVHATTRTDANGAYEFMNLRPGMYSLTETQPPQFRDYKDNVGTLGGQTENDRFSSIVVAMGASGENYNFGELQRPGCRLRSLAFEVGNMVSRDLAARSRNPGDLTGTIPRLALCSRMARCRGGVGGISPGAARLLRSSDPGHQAPCLAPQPPQQQA